MPLTAGTRLGTYEIVAPLGAGGMGEVYRAHDTRLGRDVAVKVLHADFSSHPDRLARFELEARTVAGLNHPNIVVLHSVEDADGYRFLTMELVEGQTLSAFVTPGGLPLASLLELATPLADALVAAHEKGVIHRDLKPANVMVTRDGRVKVLDFGLAKLSHTDSNPDMTQFATMAAPISRAGQVLGTVPYMAPEQLHGENVDARSDLFALGIILYELAAGKRPFTGETYMDIGHAVLRTTPEPLSRVRADLPVEFEQLVSRCLEKHPAARFQTALEVSNELRRLRRIVESGDFSVAARPAIAKVASIAVLPFVNRSANPDDEYFSDGLADELLNVLAKIRGLRVVARASSFQFKGKNEDLATIGAKLNVATLLDGSVRKAGNRVRISVQLVNAADSSHLWSETYDRAMDDIFALQDDIAQSVVKELRTTLLGEAADSDATGQAKAEVAQAAKGRGTDPEAHRLYLLARHLIDRWNREDTEKALGYLKQALELDPGFAQAWAELGRAHTMQAGQGWAPGVEALTRTREAVDRALALEPDLPEAHISRAWLQKHVDWDWKAAEASCTRALELAPGNALALLRAGTMAASLGHFEEAIRLCRRASEQDPLSAGSFHNLGIFLLASERFAKAETAFRKALELAPRRAGSAGGLALTLIALGREAEALEQALREPEGMLRPWILAIVQHALGHGPESDAALLELNERYAEDGAYQIAEVHATRGEVDAAFEWLERAYAVHDFGLVEMKFSWCLRALHADPRWGAFLRKLGLED